MPFGIRALLLLVSVILFVIAAIDDAGSDLIAWGLAALAGAFLIGEAGWDRRVGPRR